jgi:hypothetical protein
VTETGQPWPNDESAGWLVGFLLSSSAVRVQYFYVCLSVVATLLLWQSPAVAGAANKPSFSKLSPKARLAAIRRAQLWKPTDVASKDLKKGPAEADGFEPGALVTCAYRDRVMSGKTPKFTCELAPGDEIKVKYGADNGEVYAEVAATRLLWALGFPADRVYPVRVECQGCSPDPHSKKGETAGQMLFDPAAVERKMKGVAMEVSTDSGWAWPELDEVREAEGGAPRAHRDALKLLAVLLQHGDNKAAQQRLVCASKEDDEGTGCSEPWMIVQDLGVTFGRANLFNRGATGSVNYEEWSEVPVWADVPSCIGILAPSQSGSMENPHISEAGRKFLAGLLVQLSDRQLRDLFETARFAERKTSTVRAATVEQWVDAFKEKRDQIVTRTCPA